MGTVANMTTGTATRRTHVVRIGDIPVTQDNPNPTQGNYFDIEVLDAISFRNVRGEEMILNFVADNIVPYIVDDTGHGNAKTPDASEATRRSHMETVTDADGKTFFDIEILDCAAFRDQRGEEWVLDMQLTSDPTDPNDTSGEYNSTTSVGDNTDATRRVHDEQVSSPFGEADPASYVTVTRPDNLAFRNVRGEEMIIVCPSNDDPNSSDPRAATHVWSPKGGYDPADDTIVPPNNTDPNVYVFIPSGAPLLSQDARCAAGPLWWIRKVSEGGDLLVLSVTGYSNASPDYINTCFLNCPPEVGAPAGDTGKSYPLFVEINSIGAGNSKLLKTLPPDAIFTADKASTFSNIRTTGFENLINYTETYTFNTIFINLAKYTADKDGNKQFSISCPAPPTTVRTETDVIPWLIKNNVAITSGGYGLPADVSPLTYNYELYGETVYNQQGLFHNLVGPYPGVNPGWPAPRGQFTGQIFPDVASAVAYIASPPSDSGFHAENPALYAYYSMITYVQIFGPSVGVSVNTYNKKSIGGPKMDKDGNPIAGTAIPGTFQFPIYKPHTLPAPYTGLPEWADTWSGNFTDASFLYSINAPDGGDFFNPPPGDFANLAILGKQPDWPIGILGVDGPYSWVGPWPGGQWTTATNLGAGYDYPPQPAVTAKFQINAAVPGDPKANPPVVGSPSGTVSVLPATKP